MSIITLRMKLYSKKLFAPRNCSVSLATFCVSPRKKKGFRAWIYPLVHNEQHSLHFLNVPRLFLLMYDLEP